MTPRSRQVHRARVAGTLYLLLASCSGSLTLVMPTAAQSPWLAALLVGVPLFGSSLLCGLLGLAAWQTRLELGADRFRLRAPRWRAGLPAWRACQLAGAWPEIVRVRRRTEWYRLRLPPLLAGIDFPVDVYRIETAFGQLELAGRTPRSLPRIAAEIAERAGVEISAAPAIHVSWLHVLCRGTAPWPES
jgi:hypothetical protein